MQFEKTYWDQRWENGQTGWDIGHPSTPLSEYADQLDNKDIRILIPGCGNAYEAEYFINQGFKNTYALDISQLALNGLLERATSFPPQNAICEDFFEHSATYDLIIEQTFMAAIHPSERRQYVAKLADLLNPGGKVCGVLFDREFEGGPPFGGSQQEYQELFSEHFDIEVLDPCHNSIKPRRGSEVFLLAKKR